MTDVVATEVDDDLAQRVFAERMAGIGARVIARRYNISTKEVQSIVAKLSPQIDHEARRAEMALELARIDKLYAKFFVQAANGDVPSALVCIRLGERRSSLWGWDVAPTRQAPTINILQNNSPLPTSTARIRAALEHVIASRSAAPAAPVATAANAAAEPAEDPEKLY